ncbi:SDR family NAD(P)-dependent oxidoreductase [Kribbia dieselivorans]|uniref:SDR family NAD(P)-dependent oxidoreductase n=1 Tax=Kribbia dieselivorans TaxID=331526 RepID=UPI00083940AE|nr:3-oxoacyl-ACP reductase family protein [Kribbia dieselivorans]
MGRLQDKIVIVTGAGSGIGKAIALKAGAEGATVIVTDLNADSAKAVATEIGQSAEAHAVDVTDATSVNAMVAAVKETHGRIDVLVNNAGWDKAMPFLETEPDFWQQVISINYVGVLNTSKAVLPIMVEQKYGHVVNLASDAGRVGSSGESVYAGAKGAVIAFSKSAAREVARNGINVNVVCPGPTDTPLFASMGGENPKLREGLTRAIPMKRLAQPEDIANAVAFFASDEASFMTGQTVSVSGGLVMS